MLTTHTKMTGISGDGFHTMVKKMLEQNILVPVLIVSLSKGTLDNPSSTSLLDSIDMLVSISNGTLGTLCFCPRKYPIKFLIYVDTSRDIFGKQVYLSLNNHKSRKHDISVRTSGHNFHLSLSGP